MFSQQSQGRSSEWWNIPFPKTFKSDGFKNTLSFIHVEGNKFMDEQGNHIIFKGVNISDPDKLEKNGYLLRFRYIDEKQKMRGSFMCYTNKAYIFDLTNHAKKLAKKNQETL